MATVSNRPESSLNQDSPWDIAIREYLSSAAVSPKEMLRKTEPAQALRECLMSVSDIHFDWVTTKPMRLQLFELRLPDGFFGPDVLPGNLIAGDYPGEDGTATVTLYNFDELSHDELVGLIALKIARMYLCCETAFPDAEIDDKACDLVRSWGLSAQLQCFESVE